MSVAPAAARRSRLTALLDLIERVGNRLPNPVTLFVILAVVVLIASALASGLGLSVAHPRTGEPISAVNLLTREGVQRMFTQAVNNFTGFAPLGTVLVALIGIGVAERSGLFAALLRALVAAVPAWAVTPTVVFAGIMSNVASDAGYLILPPVAAALFASLGRHPVAGVTAAFAGVAAGFSANLLPGTIDVLLAGLTQEATRLIDLDHRIEVVANWYFMCASVPVLVCVGWFVNTRFVERRLGPWTPPQQQAAEEPPHPAEGRALGISGIAFLATLLGLGLLVVPSWGPLRAAGDTTLAQIRPFMDGMVAVVLIAFFVPGLAFGLATGKIRRDHDVAKMTGDTMAGMGSYIVLAFAAAQFVAYFRWSNLGTILAVGLADLLKALHFSGAPLFIAFILVATTVNLFISSASAKWTAFAPVFVPMFMLLGYSPEACQAMYRVGDSVTNVVTPLNPYLPLVLAYLHRYDPRMGLGSIIALMLPFSIAFGVVWSAMVVAWLMLGWPVGPGADLGYAVTP